MHWVLQDNIYQEYGYEELLRVLERYEIPYTQVKVIPFIHEMIPDIDIDGPVMAVGSTAMTKIAKKKGWKPGSFYNENFTYEAWSKGFGTYNILNEDAVVSRFDEIDIPMDTFFIRPCEDTKSFAGEVMNKADFKDWQSRVVGLNEDLAPLKPETMVMVSSLKEIHQEYRCFVVDRRVITASLYKVGDMVRYDKNVDLDVLQFAGKLARGWEPERAYVMDIARTPNGLKLIEINNINSAGFYDCDIGKIVEAIEGMWEDGGSEWVNGLLSL